MQSVSSQTTTAGSPACNAVRWARNADAAGVKRAVRGDVAIVTTPRGRYVIAIHARQVADTRDGPDNEAVVLMGRISRMIYDAFAGGR